MIVIKGWNRQMF